MVGRPKIELTKDDIQTAISLTTNLSEAAEYLKVSYPTFLREKKRLGLDTSRIELTERIEELERTGEMSPDEFLDMMQGVDDLRRKQTGYKYFKYKFDEPIIISILSDSHLGADTTEHYAFGKFIKRIGELSNVKVFSAGDYIDNFHKYSVGGGVHQQVIPIPRQKAIMEWIVKYLGEDLLAMVGGCHDEWSYRTDAFDLTKYLANKSNSIHLGKRGVIDLEVGEMTYSFYLKHKTRWYSSANLCHGLKKIARWWEDVDCVIAGHHHVPDAEWAFFRHKMRLFIAASSWKKPDRFIEDAGIPEAPLMTQCVVLDNEYHENTWDGMQYFNSLDQALKYL